MEWIAQKRIFPTCHMMDFTDSEEAQEMAVWYYRKHLCMYQFIWIGELNENGISCFRLYTDMFN